VIISGLLSDYRLSKSTLMLLFSSVQR